MRIFILALIVFGMGMMLMSCGSLMASSADDIVAVKKRHESWLMSLPGVVGVGIGNCDEQPCIKVYVVESTAALERQIPKQLEGFPVDTQVTGPIKIVPR